MGKKSSGRKLHVTQVLPIWTTAHCNTVNLAFQALLLRLGITDISSYFRQLRIPIAISVVVCALVGVSSHGLKGFFLGGLLGAIVPAALLWLGVMLVAVAIFLIVYVAVWAVIVSVIWWFLHT
jgi:hypothetical protein